ncbi:MAG: STAS domain-containing protein [Chitinivibrionales bacterium]|nr:STAS domain-containing protein [Chitinivibrionales bacterium]MBD3394906.1 STAS domain-containing protein [Chitinivibrionales bacterium]
MIGEITEKNGWLYVSIERPADWKLPTFFPLVDATFKKIEENHERKPRRIVFDVSSLDFIDSTIVSLFLQAARMTTTAEKNAIVVSREHTRDLLCLLGIDKLFDLYQSEKEWMEAQ